MDYYALRYLHVGCAIVSGSLFMLRGGWMFFSPALLRRRWVRLLPHLIDTMLLASAVGLAAMRGMSPFVQPWLGAKVAAVLLYIALGDVALQRGRTFRTRVSAFFAALATFIYIIAVALTKQVLPI